jgi:hypothetical protein
MCYNKSLLRKLMETQIKKQRGFSAVWAVLMTVIVTVLVIGGAIFFWQRLALEEMKRELVQSPLPRIVSFTPSPTPALTPLPTASTLSPTPVATPVFTPTPTTDPYAGWLTYTNDIYSYEFRYPSGASIEEVGKEAFSLSPDEVSAGVTFDDKYNKYTGKICITLSYKLGYVQISAPPNNGFVHVICGRTGRAYEGPARSETLTIDGRTYTASGFEERGPGETLNYHNETLVVTLEDGTRIEYGSRSDESFTFADYQTMRDEIIKIVESYRGNP